MAADVVKLSWDDVHSAADLLARRWWTDDGVDNVYGVPEGGTEPARLVAERLGVPHMTDATRCHGGTLIVDDLVDSGRTRLRYGTRFRFDALYRKPHTPPDICPSAVELDGWLVFPWETDEGPTDAVVRLLEYVGEDPTREGLVDTPRRVLSALAEMTEGLRQDPADVLTTTFEEPYDEMIVLRAVEFASLCEHHLLPFTGTATVGYIPDKRVVGISKLARLVEVFARRPQVQERMTQQIAEALCQHLGTNDAAVTVRATHHCMACRGVRKAPVMVTSTMLGAFRDKPEARAEFLHLAE